jgi:HlyD family type I secretion membrane fusion protein
MIVGGLAWSPVRTGVLAVAMSVVALLAWSALAPLEGAVITQGVLKPAGNRKLVQHAEGGVIEDLLVRNGQQVTAGEPLVVIRDARVTAQRDASSEAVQFEWLRLQRLQCEETICDRLELRGDPSGEAAGPTASARQRAEKDLFESRRRALGEQVAGLAREVDMLAAEGRALSRRMASTDEAVRLAREELASLAPLIDGQFVARTRVIAVERSLAELLAQRAEHDAAIEQNRARQAELQHRALTIRAQFRQAAAEAAQESLARLTALKLQSAQADELADRLILRAPVAGTVLALRVQARGELVPAREPVMEIVPAGDEVVVEARVLPQDIRYVQVGQKAQVRVTAFSARAYPPVAATVRWVSADAMLATDGSTGYLVQLARDAVARSPLDPPEWRPGMTAEIFLLTDGRTVFNMLMTPLTDALRRGLREP